MFTYNPLVRKEHTDVPVSSADVQCSVLPGATDGRLSVVRKCCFDLTNAHVITYIWLCQSTGVKYIKIYYRQVHYEFIYIHNQNPETNLNDL
jgi:hypothetical protein